MLRSYGGVAHLVEHVLCTHGVIGSIPIVSISKHHKKQPKSYSAFPSKIRGMNLVSTFYDALHPNTVMY